MVVTCSADCSLKVTEKCKYTKENVVEVKQQCKAFLDIMERLESDTERHFFDAQEQAILELMKMGN